MIDLARTLVQLFTRTVSDLEAFVLAQDVIHVGGGNVVNLFAVWRAHGLARFFEKLGSEASCSAGSAQV